MESAMNEYFESDKNENELFWNRKLERMEGFRFDPDHYDYDMNRFEMEQQVIREEDFTKILDFCKRNKCTPYHIILTAVMCTLFKMEYKKEVTVWLAVSSPLYKDLLADMSVVSLPLCIDFKDNLKLNNVLNTVIKQTAFIIDHQDISLNEVVETNKNLLIQNINEISNVFFNFTEDNNKKEEYDVEEIIFDNLGNNKYDLNFDCILCNDKIVIEITYAYYLFRSTRIKTVLNKIMDFIVAILNNQFEQLCDIYSNGKAYPLNNKDTNLQDDMTSRFISNVNNKPDADAIIMGEKRISYKQFYFCIQQIISYLLDNGIERGNCIAIISEKDINSVACVVALILGGFTYVPISKEYPRERVKSIIDECNIKGIIYDNFLSYFNALEVKLFSVSELTATTNNKNIVDLSNHTNQDIVYIMHTSGSTGKPKGVKISWGNLSNYCSPDGISKIILSRSSFRILSVTNFEFDISITEIFLPFIYGGCCIIVPRVLEDESLLIKYAVKNSANVIQTTPTNLKRLMLFYKANWLQYLKLVFVGGESFPKTLYDDISQKTRAVICNVYGPTEATVWTTYKIISKKPIYNIIGECLNNYKVYILQGEKEADIECVGELCIGGAGVAVGYVNGESDMNFRSMNGERIYFTGDIGRRLPSNEIEFVGRKDTQIKKGGYRIELEEISEVTKNIRGIQDVVTCLKRYDMEEVICLYYIKDKSDVIEDIEMYLLEKLPGYMMPTYYIEMKEFPVTASGKINLNKLPNPQKGKEIISDPSQISKEQREILEIIRKVFSSNTICLNDNFWKVGGTSIKAVALVNAIEKDYGIRIKLSKVLQSPDIRTLVNYIDTNIKNNFIKKERYHASSAQKRIFSMQTLNRASTSYNMPLLFRMHQYVDPKEIKKCIVNIINGYKILRTRFQTDENELWQIVYPFDAADIQIIRNNNIDLNEEMKLFVRPFLLEEEPLVRVEILIINNDEYILFDIHHIINDEASNNILLEMFDEALQSKKILNIEEMSYGEYSDLLWKQSFKKEEGAWIEYFQKIKIERLSLPREKDPDFIHIEGAKQELLLPEYIFEKLCKATFELNCSTYSILLAFLFILLKKICYQDLISVACPTSTRNNEKLENTLGLFVNTSIISCQISDDKTIQHLIREIQERILFAIENVNCPFEKIVSLCEVESVEGQPPIFDVIFNFYEDSTYKMFELLDTDIYKPKVDLTFNIIKKEDKLFFECEYITGHYSKKRINTILQQYSQLLSVYLDNLNVTIEMCDTCLPFDKEIILRKFNSPIEFKSKGKCLQDYLKDCVRMHPDNIAIEMDGTTISYKQLNEESDWLANNLINSGVKINDVIPLVIKRSIELFIGIWGILKAGGAYLPIKPEEPDLRIKYMVNNASVNCIICGSDNHIKLKRLFPDLQFVIVDRSTCKTNEYYDLDKKSKSDDLAYVIYTSGTTGNPKGVMVEHGSVINRIEWMVKEYGICEGDRLLFKTPFSFDVSVWEIFMGVFCGATVCVLPDGYEKEPEFIVKAISDYKVTIIHFVPSMLNVFLEYIKLNNSVKGIGSLRCVFSSGESLKKESVKIFQLLFDNAMLVNLYGPTEATVDVTHYECTGEEETIPIGKPIQNINIFILNGNTLTDVGIKGELCIAGIGVARGYINDTKLSSEKFVHNIFGRGKMYRTGDIACWNSSGDILFFGRKDRQVKIRGNRIELNEIEDKFLALPEIKDVKVFVEDSRLIAHVVGANKQVNIENIRKKLSLVLPAYMIPNNIILVPALYLSENGKAVGGDLVTNAKNEAKSILLDSTDKLIIKIMTEVLGHNINMDDNFIKSGGDSIQAIFVANRLQKEGVKVLARDIVASNSLYEIKSFIREENIMSTQNAKNMYSISPIMKDFFEEWPIKNKNYFNQSCLLLVKNYDREKLVNSIQTIITNHDMFRAEFTSDRKIIINKHIDIKEKIIIEKKPVLSENLVEEIYKISVRTQNSISLSENILYKFVLIEAQENSYLYICIHHLLIDAVSWGILLYEIDSLYQKQTILIPERTSFVEWTKNVNDYLDKITILEKNYWLGIINNMQSTSTQTKDINELIKETEYSIGYIDFQKYSEVMKTDKVDKKSVILALIVSAFDVKEPIVFDIENYGRGAIEDLDVAGTIGWFTFIFPVSIEPQEDLKSLSQHIYENFDSISNDGVAYGLLKDEFRKQGYKYLQSRYCFNYLGEMKAYQSDSFVEIQTETLAMDTIEHNSMGYDIVFNVFEAEKILKIRIVYKNSKGSMVKALCERMDILYNKLHVLF